MESEEMLEEIITEEEIIPVDPLQEALVKAETQRDEYLNLAQRVQADFENYRRRNISACTDAYDNGRFYIVEQILPLCDNLDRAVEATRDEGMREGIVLVRKQLTDLFEKWGVEPIDRLGQPFDPTLENAVAQATAEEGAPGTVCTVLLRGYKAGSRILRHAMVRVVAE